MLNCISAGKCFACLLRSGQPSRSRGETETLMIRKNRLWSLRRYAALKKANITHVVSALRLPLDPDLFTSYEHLVVELDDLEDENVLEYFATSNAFIQEGLDGGGGVLVHWYCLLLFKRDSRYFPRPNMTKLRSCTHCAALILMHLPTFSTSAIVGRFVSAYQFRSNMSNI